MESSPLFQQLGLSNEAEQSRIRKNEWGGDLEYYIEDGDESHLHEVPLETELAPLRSIHTTTTKHRTSSPITSRRSLQYDSRDDADEEAVICTLIPFDDDDDEYFDEVRGRNRKSTRLARRWNKRIGLLKSSALGVIICLVLVAVLLTWLSSYPHGSFLLTNSTPESARTLTDVWDVFDDDEFRVTFPSTTSKTNLSTMKSPASLFPDVPMEHEAGVGSFRGGLRNLRDWNASKARE